MKYFENNSSKLLFYNWNRLAFLTQKKIKPAYKDEVHDRIQIHNWVSHGKQQDEKTIIYLLEEIKPFISEIDKQLGVK